MVSVMAVSVDVRRNIDIVALSDLPSPISRKLAVRASFEGQSYASCDVDID